MISLNKSAELASLDTDPINNTAGASHSETMQLLDFLRKLAILTFSFGLTNYVSLAIIGVINRIFGSPIKSVFLCYPATEKYAHKYAFKWAFRYMKKNPLIVGVYFQSFRVGLILATSAQEDFFRSNKEYLSSVSLKLERIRKIVGAESSYFAGTLPTELSRMALMDSSYFKERCSLVADIVIESEKQVREQEQIFEVCPILLLGGKGNIGGALKEKLLEQGREVYIVDAYESFPSHMFNKKAILIDVSRKGVLESRLDTLWSKLVILNESFPEPDDNLVKLLGQKGIPVYHVAGVKAKAYPPFPYGYAGGIPCCAAIRQTHLQSLVKRLEPDRFLAKRR